MALGATRPRIVILVLQQTVSLIGIGVITGGVGGIFSARAIRSFLFGVAPGNPMIFVVSALVLCMIALLAALLPVRRANAINPVESLRTD